MNAYVYVFTVDGVTHDVGKGTGSRHERHAVQRFLERARPLSAKVCAASMQTLVADRLASTEARGLKLWTWSSSASEQLPDFLRPLVGNRLRAGWAHRALRVWGV